MSDALYGTHGAGRVTQALLRLAPAIRHHAWTWCEQNGLSPTQADILVLLMEHGKPLRLTDIAAATQLKPATASISVRALVQKGLLIKAHSSADRRTLAIRLSAAGRRTAKKATTWPLFLVDALSKLNEKDQASIARAMDKMLDELRKAGQLYVRGRAPD